MTEDTAKRLAASMEKLAQSIDNAVKPASPFEKPGIQLRFDPAPWASLWGEALALASTEFLKAEVASRIKAP